MDSPISEEINHSELIAELREEIEDLKAKVRPLERIEFPAGDIVRDRDSIYIDLAFPDQPLQVAAGGGGGFEPRAPLQSAIGTKSAPPVPTVGELQTAIEAAYTAASLTPQHLDLWISEGDIYHYQISTVAVDTTGMGIVRFPFSISSVNYWAINTGANAWA